MYSHTVAGMSTASRASDQAADAAAGWRIGQAAIAAAGSGLPSSCRHAAARTLTGFQSATACSQPGIAVVAMNAFAPFVPFLGFQAQGGDGPGVQAGQTDRLTGLLAVAVGAFVDSPKGLVDLRDQLALAVAGAQLDGAIGLG